MPESLHSETLAKLDEAHQGIEKKRLRARSCVFWNGINRDIEVVVRKCATYQEVQRAQPREPIKPPTRSVTAEPVEPLVTPAPVEPVQEPVGSPVRKDSGKRVRFEVAHKGYHTRSGRLSKPPHRSDV